MIVVNPVQIDYKKLAEVAMLSAAKRCGTGSLSAGAIMS